MFTRLVVWEINLTTKTNFMNKKTLGLILLVLGIVLIIVAQTISSEYQDRTGVFKDDSTKKNLVLYSGIGLLLIGGIISAITFTRKK